MKKVFVMVIMATMAMGMSSCSDNQADEQMEARQVVMNKGGKTDKTDKVQKDPFAKGKDKNEKLGIMPLETRSAAMYVDEDIIRHPLVDGSSTSDKPANGGGSSSTSTSSRKTQSGPITRPLK